MATKHNGIILWAGASLLDGAPIIVVATGLAKSRNVKTGNMLQTWIIRADMHPVDAVKSGADASICGDCKHRGEIVDGAVVGRSCYVLVHNAPASVYRTVAAGKYPVAEGAAEIAAVGRGRIVRLGSYGDPAAVPFWVWEALVSEAVAHTGYTHQWRRAPELAALCMASCDSADDLAAARMLGFRAFRVRRSTDPVLPREVICPASAEAGFKTTCSACRACGGTSAKARADIVIAAHGFGTRAFERRAAA